MTVRWPGNLNLLIWQDVGSSKLSNTVALPKLSGRVRPSLTLRAVISSRCGSVKFDLPVPQSSGATLKTQIKKNGGNPGEVLTEEDMYLREKANLESALQQTDWKIYGAGGAAELLGLKPTTLLSRIKKMGIEKSY